MSKELNLDKGKRAKRESFIHVAEWEEYTLLAVEPDDWSTNFEAYYTKESGEYVHVQGVPSQTPGDPDVAPTFATNTYFSGQKLRERLGVRVPDSSIEFNVDKEKTTDICGITYTDINKTEPTQAFEPFNLIGGSKLGAYLYDAAIHNRVTDYNQTFNVYIIAGFMGDNTNGYETVMHQHCTINPTSIGGESYVQMPIEVDYSNDIVSGTVDKLADDFTFTPDVTV